jgi:hypothetical protein
MKGRRGNASLTVPGESGQRCYCRIKFLRLYVDSPHGRWSTGRNAPSTHKVRFDLTHSKPPFVKGDLQSGEPASPFIHYFGGLIGGFTRTIRARSSWKDISVFTGCSRFFFDGFFIKFPCYFGAILIISFIFSRASSKPEISLPIAFLTSFLAILYNSKDVL